MPFDKLRTAGAPNVALPGYADVEAAAGRLEGVAHRTPIATSREFNARTGCEAYFKCENFQRMGAFKFRGAYNALSQLGADERARGVVAFSSGNHAQAVALAGRLLGIPAAIVMPADAPAVKVAATRGYGADVILYDRDRESREDVARRIAAERGSKLIPPFDHAHVIAGQGTAAKELIEDIGALDLLVVPCGGAGLLSGSAIAARHLSPGIRVVGVEPAAGDDAARSLRTRTLQRVENPRTIADGARTESLGALTFPLVLENVNDIVTVSDPEVVEAMRLLWERMKLVVEPTGALATAGVLTGRCDARGKRVGIILSGGNVDLKAAAALFA
jgi:threonine dehydratase